MIKLNTPARVAAKYIEKPLIEFILLGFVMILSFLNVNCLGSKEK